MRKSNDWFGDIFDEIDNGLKDWGAGWRFGFDPKQRRRRRQIFESGDVKYLVLKLIRERPRHGYDIIKALEERMGGCYTPSAGTVYPTLQLLEDEGFIRAVETEGKKVYHITPEGETFLDDHRDTIEAILDRVRETVRDVTGGPMRELHESFARLARVTYRWAWRRGPHDEITRRMIDILRKATEDIRQAQEERRAASRS